MNLGDTFLLPEPDPSWTCTFDFWSPWWLYFFPLDSELFLAPTTLPSQMASGLRSMPWASEPEAQHPSLLMGLLGRRDTVHHPWRKDSTCAGIQRPQGSEGWPFGEETAGHRVHGEEEVAVLSRLCTLRVSSGRLEGSTPDPVQLVLGYLA